MWGAFEDGATEATLNDNLRGVAITSFTTYPKGRMLTITALSGERVDEWLDPLYEKLTALWKSENCLGLEEWGRSGWIRKLKKYGFRQSHVLLEDLSGQGLQQSADPDDIDSNAD